MSESENCVALVSCPPDAAKALARTLVESRHAACVNILPGITSVYRWEKQLQEDDETLLVIKTTRARFEALRDAVLQHHPYELPEIIAVDIAAGYRPYLDWIRQCVA